MKQTLQSYPIQMCIATVLKLLGSDNNVEPKWVNISFHYEIA